MNAELPPFKAGEHNFESVSTLDRDITPLRCDDTLRYINTDSQSTTAHSVGRFESDQRRHTNENRPIRIGFSVGTRTTQGE